MLVKVTLLAILLGIIVFFVVRYHVQLFLFIFRNNDKQAIYVPSFTKHLQLMKKSLPLIAGKSLLDL